MSDIKLSEIPDVALRIQALQRGYTSPKDEREIAWLITSVEGMELTHLKNLIDRGGDHCDLLELLYSDIDDLTIRNEILNHIKNHSLKASVKPLRVLSDVDDTLYASLHDVRYPRGTLYPGVLSLHQELHKASLSNESLLAALILLTARPRDKFGVIERWTQRQMSKKGLPEVTVLSGTLFDLRSHQAMARRKLHNFGQYQELYPEYKFLFFGDSGQGDALLGQMMLEQYPDRVSKILIHQVNDRSTSDGMVSFQTYLGAARALNEASLLSREACQRIYEESLATTSAIEFDSPAQQERAIAALEKDAVGL